MEAYVPASARPMDVGDQWTKTVDIVLLIASVVPVSPHVGFRRVYIRKRSTVQNNVSIVTKNV